MVIEKNNPRQNRSDRLSKPLQGNTSSHSLDFIMAIEGIIKIAKPDALSSGSKNATVQTLSIIPLLFSAFRCFVIECAYMPRPHKPESGLLRKLTEPNDFEEVLNWFKTPDDLRKDGTLLLEIRNEIIHPSTLPTGTPNNWPEYLQEIKNKGLLEETGRENSNFRMLHQICSYRLIEWACETIKNVVLQVVKCYSDQPYHLSTIETLAQNFVHLAKRAKMGEKE